MADRLTPEQRHKTMQNIKSKDTSIEIKLRKALWKAGVRYRKNYTKLLGKPDIAITKHNIAVFCDSAFWHGKDYENSLKPKTNADYWDKKIRRNIQRDIEVNESLKELGWTVIRFWDKDIEKHTDLCVEKVIKTIDAAKNGIEDLSNC